MEVFSKSDIGLVRNENQDSSRFGVISPSCVWAIVCDGMGGANGGKTASSTAVEYISDKIEKLYNDSLSKDDIATFLTEIVANANLKIFEKATKDIELTGMGTTCELVLVKDSVVHVVHVGDSRTYAIRGGKIRQLTEDHSVVQEMVRRGELTQEQALNHPNKNFITRALGIMPEVHLDYIEANFNYGDVLLLCTDGLTNCVSPADLVKIAHENRGNDMIDKYIQKAIEGGGTDNITVTVIY
ncbi:MAG: Stp1/IreP family PP2C-type Ser/Thr phosphatase [Acutalibacteraceae bacterium]